MALAGRARAVALASVILWPGSRGRVTIQTVSRAYRRGLLDAIGDDTDWTTEWVIRVQIGGVR